MESTLNQYLTFKLGADRFAVDVAKAREVLDNAEITMVPQMPDYMLGVINLRGSVVPVIDLRRKFGMASVEATVDTCIIVIEVEHSGGVIVVGAQVDAVHEVLDLPSGQIEPPPRIGTRLNTSFIKGMGNVDDQFLIILDIDAVFTHSDLAVLEAGETETEIVA